MYFIKKNFIWILLVLGVVMFWNQIQTMLGIGTPAAKLPVAGGNPSAISQRRRAL